MSRNDRVAGRHRLKAEDHALWDRLTTTVRPLSRARLKSARVDADTAEAPSESAPVAPADVARGRRAPPALPLAPLDRRIKQRLARGGESIEKRLDLHGRTQAEANAELLRFLRGAQDRGVKFVLVITGKGTRADDSSIDRGILKRQVPLWLRLPKFRPYVVSFEEAHARHGGEGALYVRVRRRRD